MADEAVGNDRASGAEALPRTYVLGYLTNPAAMVTRVRRVTAAAMRCIAAPFLLLASVEVMALTSIGWRLWQLYLESLAPPGSYYYSTYFNAAYYSVYPFAREDNQYGCLLVALLTSVVPAVVLFGCAGAVRRGHSGVSKVCAAMALPLVFQAVVVGAIAGTAALWLGAGIYRSSADRVHLLWLIGTTAAGLLALLTWDVRSYLKWISRNPLEEKPAVAFLPRAGEAEVTRGG